MPRQQTSKLYGDSNQASSPSRPSGIVNEPGPSRNPQPRDCREVVGYDPLRRKDSLSPAVGCRANNHGKAPNSGVETQVVGEGGIAWIRFRAGKEGDCKDHEPNTERERPIVGARCGIRDRKYRQVNDLHGKREAGDGHHSVTPEPPQRAILKQGADTRCCEVGGKNRERVETSSAQEASAEGETQGHRKKRQAEPNQLHGGWLVNPKEG